MEKTKEQQRQLTNISSNETKEPTQDDETTIEPKMLMFKVPYAGEKGSVLNDAPDAPTRLRAYAPYAPDAPKFP